jgi:hypothetical protein
MKTTKVQDPAGNIYFLDKFTLGNVQKLSYFDYEKQAQNIKFFKEYGKALIYLEQNPKKKKILISPCVNVGEGYSKNRYLYTLKY